MPQRLWAFLAVVVAIAGVAIAFGGVPHLPSAPVVTVADVASHPPVQAAASSTVQTNAIVIRAIDGDTLDVRFDGESKDSRIRLLGINTPETVDPRKPVECFGKEASMHMHQMVDGQRIRLEADPQADERDKYDRLLRNVILADGTDVNAEEVRDGFAYAYLSFPLDPQRKKELKDLQEDAKLHQRGLWSPTTCNGKK